MSSTNTGKDGAVDFGACSRDVLEHSAGRQGGNRQ